MKFFIKVFSICLVSISIFSFTGCSSKHLHKQREEHPVITEQITSEGSNFYVTNLKDTTVEKEYEQGTMPTFNIIKDKAAYDTFLDTYNKKYKLTDIEYMSKYDEEYFKNNSVIFIKTIETKGQANYTNVCLKDVSTIEITKKVKSGNKEVGFAVMFTALEFKNTLPIVNLTPKELSINFNTNN